MSESNRTSHYQTILDAGAALATQSKAPGTPYAVVPAGYTLEDIERFAEQPARARASVTVDTVESFVDYYERYSLEDYSMIFASVLDFRLIGIVDWHSHEAPAFGEHRVTYQAPRAPEWDAWCGNDGRSMSQEDFAYFIEENLNDIVEPDGAEVLEVAQRLEATSKVEFVSAIRLSDGQREFSYSETSEGSSRRGALKVPEAFTLGIPVFLGGEPYEVTARLRWRIHDRKLKLWYELRQRSRVEQHAFQLIVDAVADKVDTPVIAGTPGGGFEDGETITYRYVRGGMPQPQTGARTG